MRNLAALLLGTLALIDHIGAAEPKVRTLPRTRTSNGGPKKLLLDDNLRKMAPALKDPDAAKRSRIEDRPGFDANAKGSFLSTASAQMGVIYPLVESVMRPIMEYFDGIQAFSAWHQENGFRPLSHAEMAAMLDELNENVAGMEDLDGFWKRILGVFIPKKAAEIKQQLKSLEKQIDAEEASSLQRAFEPIYRRKIENDRNFYENALQVVDNLNVGTRNHDQRLFKDVYDPFLNAAVYFRELELRIQSVI
jgi:hypothetical protein